MLVAGGNGFPFQGPLLVSVSLLVPGGAIMYV